MIGHAIYLMKWAYHFSRKEKVSEQVKPIDKYFQYKFR